MTLRRRIVAGVALILAACLGVAFVTVHASVRSQLRSAIDQDLRGDMRAFRQAVRRAGDPTRVAQEYIASQPFRSTARLLYAVPASGAPITNETSLLDADDASLFRTPAGLSTRRVSDVGGLRLLVVRQGSTVLGVGEPVESIDRALEGVDHGLLIATVLALLVAVIAGTGLSLGVTRPLRRMARVAGEVDGGDLAPRMGGGLPRDEVGQLAEAFDTMLDRLQDAFDRQTVFVAEASHELRTPLTVIRGQLEVLAAQAAPDVQEVRRVEAIVVAEITHMSRLVDDLLVLAAPSVRPQTIDLPAFLEGVIDALRVTTDRSLELGDVATVSFTADPDRLGQALRNVIRNAIEHTSADGRIRVTAETDTAHLRIIVDDDGPGIPEAERERVFERFHRTSAAPAGKNAGLGLAIVRAVAQAHDGDATVTESPLGGVRVVLALPR